MLLWLVGGQTTAGLDARVLGCRTSGKSALSIESMCITHRCCICEFAYLLKFISNPQVNMPRTHAFEGFSESSWTRAEHMPN